MTLTAKQSQLYRRCEEFDREFQRLIDHMNAAQKATLANKLNKMREKLIVELVAECEAKQ